jgi:hypothetical protein
MAKFRWVGRYEPECGLWGHSINFVFWDLNISADTMAVINFIYTRKRRKSNKKQNNLKWVRAKIKSLAP